jgi:hypothetical protein
MFKVKVKIDESAYSQNCIKIPLGQRKNDCIRQSMAIDSLLGKIMYWEHLGG